MTGYDASIADGQQQTLQLTGTLDLHGVQKTVTWELKGHPPGERHQRDRHAGLQLRGLRHHAAQHRRLRLGAGPRHAAGADHRAAIAQQQ
jgi:hypothetical protein